MRPWARFLICGVAGLLVGAGGALWSVKTGAMGSSAPIGPWTTGRDFGSADASAKTRAMVALTGLLALPAREARYYMANVDDAGQPLDGRCTYKVTGGEGGGAWWSLTLYDLGGYLVGNGPRIFSVNSAAVTPAEQGAWTVNVAPGAQPGHWLPTGGIDRFNLTLRVYLPADGGKSNLTRAQLPHIAKQGCA